MNFQDSVNILLNIFKRMLWLITKNLFLQYFIYVINNLNVSTKILNKFVLQMESNVVRLAEETSLVRQLLFCFISLYIV